MDRDHIDASIGLKFSLDLLKKYQEDGLLQAEVSRLPGILGTCEVSISILKGNITSCLAKDEQGFPYTCDINVLLKLDKNRGPFEWNLLPLPEGTALSQQHPPSLQTGQFEQSNVPIYKPTGSPIPRITARLNLDQFTRWTPGQKQALFQLYVLIDGTKTIEEIKQEIDLSPQLVEEGLRLLQTLNAIIIPS